ncbi:MAG: SUMF1/EgtB/PvdO family nonheme iron enzyme [bacterium]
MNKVKLVLLLLLVTLGNSVWAAYTPAPLPTKQVNPNDGAEMVLIPAGDFMMGTSEFELANWLAVNTADKREEYAAEMPQRSVYLDAYYMYKTEVTVAQYRNFCMSTKRLMPSEPDWKWHDTDPIVNVTWLDAKAYADWAGVGLPTEAQWEKAARGDDGRTYPWGEAWPPKAGVGNFADKAAGKRYGASAGVIPGYNDGFVNIAPVGSFTANPFGLFDMEGNVSEWCADRYGDDYYQYAPAKNPLGATSGELRVIRGDPGYGGIRSLRSANRGYLAPKEKSINTGFRCSVLPATRINAKDGAEMMFVPAGEFFMGTSEEELAAWLKEHPGDKREMFADEMPQHKVQLDSYLLYKTEVTVAQYRKFCTETERNMPPEPEWKWQDTDPIVNVTWADAKAYADWAGMTLPTEAQWEKAARGTDKRVYPWGNTWDAAKMQCSTTKTGDAKKVTSVGEFPQGASPYGVLDMAGNVYEWCADWYNADYYKTTPLKNPAGPTTGTEKIQRGGAWDDFASGSFRSTYRPTYNPTFRSENVGFRCVSLPQIKINPVDGAEMVLIPAGEYIDQKSKQKISVDAFYMYKTEVTVEQYRIFCTATNQEMPYPGSIPWPQQNDYPVVWLPQGFSDAYAYAKWAGVKIPSEAQWKYTARGGDSRIYPWGNSWPPPAGTGNFADQSVHRNIIYSIKGYTDGYSYASPVASFPPNPYGLYDIDGNVMELCGDSSRGEGDYQRKDVLCGGSYDTQEPELLRVDYRVVVSPGWQYDFKSCGFRCTMPLK